MDPAHFNKQLTDWQPKRSDAELDACLRIVLVEIETILALYVKQQVHIDNLKYISGAE